MGYQSLSFNGKTVLAYIDTPTEYKLKENDIIYAMQLNLYFQVTSKKTDTLALRGKGFERIKNTQLRNAGVLKFKSDNEELYVERKTHLLLNYLNS